MEVDKSNMRQVINNLPKHLAEGLEFAENVKLEGGFKNVVVCGMGGSALPADLLSIFGIPIFVHRDYNLPKAANKESLVICISYSGNTEETLSSLKKSLEKKLKIVCISSGGKVEKISKENKIPFVKIPSGIQPRSATGYIFSSLAKVLENSGFNKNISSEIKETVKQLEKVNFSLEKEGEILAKKLIGKIPIVYSSEEFGDLARNWKIKFNENSKVPAFYNYFPELNHNEMVGFSDIGKKTEGQKSTRVNFHIIMLKDLENHPRTQKRMKLTADLLKKSGIAVDFVKIREGSLLFKVFSTLLLGDWTSYYLALKNKIDPAPVHMVEEFKKLLNN